MEADERVFLFGEDVGVYGGAFGVSGDLLHRFGPERVIDTPISELGLAGAAVGAALTGMKPVLEIQFSDFVTLAMEQIVNQAAKIHFMFGGKASVPMVVRLPGGSGTGAAATAQPEPGSVVRARAGSEGRFSRRRRTTPRDCLLAAIDDPNPVLIFEHKLLYKTRGPVPADAYRVPIGSAAVRRAGRDISIVAGVIMAMRAAAAAERLASEGIDAEVIDLRSLRPIDFATIAQSVQQDPPPAHRLRRRQDHGHRRRDLGDDRGKRRVRFPRCADRAPRRRRCADSLQPGAGKGCGAAGRRRSSPRRGVWCAKESA